MKIIFILFFLIISVKTIEEYPDSHILILNYELSTIDGINLNSTLINGVSYNNGTVSIKSSGTYILSGYLEGQVFISLQSEDKVTLVLNGVSIYSESNNALTILGGYELVKNYTDSYLNPKTLDYNDIGAKIIIADGTKNRIDGKRSNSGDVTIHSFISLLITGEKKSNGELNIIGKKEGIETDRLLFINGGILRILAQDYGINVKGKYFCIINGGKILINSGLLKEEDTIDSNGSVFVNGGQLELACLPASAYDNGLKVVDDIIIDGGNVFSVECNIDRVSSKSTQPIMNLFFNLNIAPSSTLIVKDFNGNEIIRYCANTADFIRGTERSYTTAVVSHSSFKVNSIYYIYLNGKQLGYTGNNKKDSQGIYSVMKTDFILGPGATNFYGIQKIVS